MLTFGPKLNRSYSLYLPFMKQEIEVSIMFHKSSTFVGFNTEQKIYNMVRENQVHSYIYKELSESAFASTFLELRDFRSNNLDIKLQFNNIQERFRGEIQYISNETVKVSKVKTKSGEFESSLYVYVFGFHDYGDNFLYFLAERQHIDCSLDRKVVRTYGLQLCSNSIYEDFLKKVEFFNGKETKPEGTDAVIDSVFQSKQNKNNRIF